MNIGIIIGRIGDVDGVALETEKWIEVLIKMGHKVFILSGRFKNHVVPVENETLYPNLSFFSPDCEWEQNRAFFFPNDDPSELMLHLEDASDKVARVIFEWALKNRIDSILAENSTALPCHLSMGMGIKKAAEVMGIPIVAHDHDFYWERGLRYKSPHKDISKIVENTFPLILPNVKHAVINIYSRDELKNRFDVDSEIVPNVMDFNKPYGRKDSYNRDLLQNIKLDSNDIALFQITRIVQRKGIETAINLIHRLEDKRLKLVITGSTADDERKGYYAQLIHHIKKLKVRKQIIFGHNSILSERGSAYRGRKIYSLSDAYANAVACTYFSTYEGFGNAFVECILARKPIFVNNYKPVYWPDIGSKGFKAVMLEDNQLTDKKVAEIREILFDKSLQKDIAKHNFNLGKKHFSFEVLQEKLEKLFKF